MKLYFETSAGHLHKQGEELCGDKIEIVKREDKTYLVLADGLGSGVKANILASLTSKIVATMFTQGAELEDVVETIASTLPVCSERKLAYSTFTFLELDVEGNAYLVEYDNPPMLWLRHGRVLEIPYEERTVAGKRIRQARFAIQAEDVFVLMSDGVTHAGLGNLLAMGWKRDNVARYLQTASQRDSSPRTLQALLLQACKSLYQGQIRDDASVCVCRARIPSQTCVMVGPPQDRSEDEVLVQRLLAFEGQKVVCGGTTSQIVSRVTGKELEIQLDYISPEVPPVAMLEGIDLVTEGIITMQHALELIRAYAHDEPGRDQVLCQGRDGAHLLAQCLVQNSTSITFMVGRALNPAYDVPGMPLDLTLKLRLVRDMAKCLRELDKQVTLEFH